MGLKDWGEGLEELTESYYRYANQRKGETWFVTNGVIGERIKKKRSRKNKSKKGSRSPVEIDLIAFLIDDNYKIKKIHAIQSVVELIILLTTIPSHRPSLTGFLGFVKKFIFIYCLTLVMGYCKIRL